MGIPTWKRICTLSWDVNTGIDLDKDVNQVVTGLEAFRGLDLNCGMQLAYGARSSLHGFLFPSSLSPAAFLLSLLKATTYFPFWDTRKKGPGTEGESRGCWTT